MADSTFLIAKYKEFPAFQFLSSFLSPKDNDKGLADFYTYLLEDPAYIQAECIYNTTRPYAFMVNNYKKPVNEDFSDSQYESPYDSYSLDLENTGTEFKQPNDLSASSNVTVGIHDYFCSGPFFFTNMSEPGILTCVQVSHAYDAPNIHSKARRIIPSNFMLIKAYKQWIVIVTVCRNNDFEKTTGSKILINKIIDELKEYNKTVKISDKFTHVVLESPQSIEIYLKDKRDFTKADNDFNSMYVNNQNFLSLFPKFANVSLLVDNRYLSLGQASLLISNEIKIEGQLIIATVSFKTYARKI